MPLYKMGYLKIWSTVLFLDYIFLLVSQSINNHSLSGTVLYLELSSKIEYVTVLYLELSSKIEYVTVL